MLTRAGRFAFWVTIGYAVFAALWVVAGDSLLNALGASVDTVDLYRSLRDLLFVALTSGMLFFHTARLAERRRARTSSDPFDRVNAKVPATGNLVPLVGAATLVFLGIAAVGLNLSSNYDRAVEDARASSADLATALSHQIEQNVVAVNVALRALSGEIASMPAGPDRIARIEALMALQQNLLPQARSIFVLDAAGEMVTSTDQVPSGTSFADRDYYIGLKADPSSNLFIGQVIKSRVDGAIFIGAARAITDSHGRFQGIVAARLDPQFFERELYDLDVGPHGAIALIHQSGVIVARVPRAGPETGAAYPLQPALRDPSRRAGFFDAVSKVDQRERVDAFRRLSGVPMTVVVGRDRADILDVWRGLLGNAVTALAIFIFVVVALGILLQRQVRRQAQLIDQLRLSEARFYSFLSNTDAMAWITDGEGQIQYANQALARLIDVDEERLIGTLLDRVLPSSEGVSHASLIAQVTSTLVNIQSVSHVPSREGEIELLIQYFPLGEARGEHRVGGLALDVTSQRAAERDKALHDRVLAFSPNGVCICSADGDMELVYVNPAFERITGYSAAEVLGRNCRFLQSNDHDQDGMIELRDALSEQREVEVTLRNYRKDGTLFWNETRLAPVRDPNNKVTHYVGTMVDVTERKQFEAQLAFQGSHDLLTRLPNRTLFEERLDLAIGAAGKQVQMLALVFIDIDHFQHANDSMGRGGGDLLLRRVAERIERVAGAGDTVGRVGGDEFALTLTGHTSEQSVGEALSRLLSQFIAPERIGDQEISLSISAGVALFPRDGANVAILSRNAELAMNSAKEADGGVIHWFQPFMDRQAAERLAREGRLRRALERDELVLHYQPQVNAYSGEVIGVEALMRWQDPTVGLVFPARFIPLAEDTGLIVPMGEWALREACRQNKAWQQSGVLMAAVAVNVSMAQFRQAGFAQTVKRALEDSGLAAQYLEIEITESLVMDDPELLISTLRELKRLGVCISIDDFGTGYSSLNYLKRLPIDKLKIDRSFVGDITQDPDDAALCRSIVEIAHSLRLFAIAEGVETAAQAHFLARHHCDQLQGYLFSKPLPAAEVEACFSKRFDVGLSASADMPPCACVLVVDDDEDSAAALTAVISNERITVKVAKSAAQAFEVLAGEDIAVIISDYRMPDMNGVALLARVKLLYPETIRMIVTAFPGYEQAADAINQAGIFKFLVKPSDPDHLRDDIRNALDLHQRLNENERLRDTLDYSRYGRREPH